MNIDIRTTSMALFCFYCYMKTYFTHFSSVIIVGFEQVNVYGARYTERS